MTLSAEERYLIVADRPYWSLLLNQKKDFPQLDFKLMEKNEFLSLVSFSYAEDPIPYVLSTLKYDYSRAKKLIGALRVADLSKDKELEEWKKEFEEKGFISDDPLAQVKLQRRTILLFERDEDLELKGLLERKSIPYKLAHFSDFGIEPKRKGQPPAYLFRDKTTQYLYLLSDLRKRIVEDKDKPEDFIFFTDAQDAYYLTTFAQIFRIPVSIRVRTPLTSDKEVKDALVAFSKNHNFNLEATPKEDSPLASVQFLIQRYQLEKLPFDIAYPNLIEILNGNKFMNEISADGIPCTDQLFFDDSKVIVTNFVFDTFYKNYADDNIFPDTRLVEDGINPSYVLTELDRRNKDNFLTYNDILSLSRVKLHLQDKIYDSQFLKEKGWKMESKNINEEGSYTKEALLLLKAKVKDDNFLPADKEYKNFDHSFSGISSPVSHSYSVTDFDVYYNCPFQYYMDRVLSVDQDDPDRNFYSWSFGSLAHKVMEKIFEPDFDFETQFALGVEEFKQNLAKNGLEFNSTYKAYLEIAKPHLKDFAEKIRSQKDHGNITGEIAEKTVNFTIRDDETGKSYRLHGKIDKLVYTRGEGGLTYYTIVDYKSGSTAFDIDHVFLGGSLQLPLYSLALEEPENADLTRGGQFAGFGIQHIFASTFPKDKNHRYSYEAIASHITIKGLAYFSEDYFKSFDQTMYKPKKDGSLSLSPYHKGDYLNAKVAFYDDESQSVIPKVDYSYAQFRKDVKKATINSLKGMEEKKFQISPVLEASEYNADYLPCRFCSYRNICYRSLDDIRNVYPELEDKFSGHAEEEGEDNGLQ